MYAKERTDVQFRKRCQGGPVFVSFFSLGGMHGAAPAGTTPKEEAKPSLIPKHIHAQVHRPCAGAGRLAQAQHVHAQIRSRRHPPTCVHETPVPRLICRITLSKSGRERTARSMKMPIKQRDGSGGVAAFLLWLHPRTPVRSPIQIIALPTADFTSPRKPLACPAAAFFLSMPGPLAINRSTSSRHRRGGRRRRGMPVSFA